MQLFLKKDVILHSGQPTDFKIECDALSYPDIEMLAFVISKKYKFRDVYGVPSGGIKFEAALANYRNTHDLSLPILIIDDVLTTGHSMNDYRKKLTQERPDANIIGVVIFSRGKCPAWVDPIFQMWKEI
jgi:hypoxanthine phosphoribosyltransferase